MMFVYVRLLDKKIFLDMITLDSLTVPDEWATKKCDSLIMYPLE